MANSRVGATTRILIVEHFSKFRSEEDRDEMRRERAGRPNARVLPLHWSRISHSYSRGIIAQ
jgi:hypothetical protein